MPKYDSDYTPPFHGAAAQAAERTPQYGAQIRDNYIVPPAPPKPATLDTLYAALGEADQLADSVITLVNDLIGTYPEPGSIAKDRAVQDGTLNAVSFRAETVRERIQTAHTSLSRLRNSL